MGIHGDSEGLEEAVFWCFARMGRSWNKPHESHLVNVEIADLCGGLISSESSLIPSRDWIVHGRLAMSMDTPNTNSAFQDQAKYGCYLAAAAIDLFARYGASEGAFGSVMTKSQEVSYTEAWQQLWTEIDCWFDRRRPEMQPVSARRQPETDPSQPFPSVLYLNGAAIASAQIVHTAAILMLQRRPRHLRLKIIRPMLWHARQVCAIASSNNHHGSWTNSVQPLWIAGKLMSHPSEHQAIVKILIKIECTTGWSTQNRIEDLKTYWGDIDNEFLY